MWAIEYADPQVTGVPDADGMSSWYDEGYGSWLSKAIGGSNIAQIVRSVTAPIPILGGVVGTAVTAIEAKRAADEAARARAQELELARLQAEAAARAAARGGTDSPTTGLSPVVLLLIGIGALILLGRR